MGQESSFQVRAFKRARDETYNATLSEWHGSMVPSNIYPRIIDELSQEEDGQCDHAKLAVTTLLLALLLQRMGDTKGTRSVFLSFFRIVVLEMDEDNECACSAKVLQAFALFEMKRGHSLKSLDLATKAIKLDKSLASILKWKQFRDAKENRESFMARAALSRG